MMFRERLLFIPEKFAVLSEAMDWHSGEAVAYNESAADEMENANFLFVAA